MRGQDRFERDAEAGGVADLGGEGGGQGDRVLLFVAGRWDGCGDLVGQGERPVGVETQGPRIVEHDAVVDEVPVPRKSWAIRRTPVWTPKRSNSHSSTNARPPATIPPAGSGSSSRRSSRSSHCSSNASPLSSSSSTVKPGGRPASMGKSNSTRRANAWSVPIGAWSRRSSAADACSVRRVVRALRTRVRSSAAAFSVNVIAATPVMSIPSSTRLAMRSTSELVLPAPRRPRRTTSRRDRSGCGAPSLVGRQVGRRSGPVLAGEVLSGPVLS